MQDVQWSAADAGQQARVLIVSAHPSSAKLLCQGLNQAGFEVTVVHHLGDALTAIGGWMPELIVLDSLAPGDDERTICRQLREVVHGGIIMLVRDGGTEKRIVCLESGADDCLTRPVTIRELVARARAVLRCYGIRR